LFAALGDNRISMNGIIDEIRSAVERGQLAAVAIGGYLDEPDAGPAMAGSPKIEAPVRNPGTFSETDWLERLAQYQKSRTWPACYWGPAPGEPGCLVPAALIVKPIGAGPTHGDRTAPPSGAKNDLDIPDFLRRAAPERPRALALGLANDDSSRFE
jgi:hypothetical protein